MVAHNTLSQMATHIRDFLQQNLTGVNITVGPPADAQNDNENASPGVNLFFYRYEPSGFYPDTTPNDPFYLHIFCLITAHGSSNEIPTGEASKPSDGELSVRVLGNVMQAFHEHPEQQIIFTRPVKTVTENPATVGGTLCQAIDEIANIQVIFKTLTLEEINQIWSTQGDTIFRSAIAYEFALVPIHPCTRPKEAGPEVSEIDIRIRANTKVPDPVQDSKLEDVN